MKRFAYILLLTLACFSSQAQLTEQSEAWLITCTPGVPAWAHYGHTAIRIKDASQNIDVFYNYGLFDFNQPDFYIKFIKGQTDYMLGREDSAWFYYDYREIDRHVYEQKLNLTLDQRNRLLILLETNLLPENRTYRYNFVFNNCATKPYDLIRQVVGSDFSAPLYAQREDTFRDRIYYYSGRNTWAGWGINLLFGRDADQTMTPEQRLFLPEELMDFMQEASFTYNGKTQKIVLQSHTQPFVPRNNGWLLSPSFAILLLSILIGAITAFDLSKHKISWWLDAILFLAYGLLGCLMAFLALFSEHPFVSSNFNLLFFNPFMLIPFVMSLFHKGRYYLLKADVIFGAYISLALIIYVICGQEFHSLVIITIIHTLRIRFTWFGNQFLLGQRTLRNIRRTSAIILLTLLTATSHAQEPHLTVVVVVDGLNNKTLQQIKPSLLPGGLRTIIDEGHGSRVYFPQLINGGCESVATIVTGVTPFYHGISADTRFNTDTRAPEPILQDTKYAGIGTPHKLSPNAILAPTITDIFRLHNGKDSRIYAIGINPVNTILLGGHAANACVWLEQSKTGTHWATTNYYPIGLHPTADLMNTTLFRSRAKQAPAVDPNSAVINLASKIQENERLGEGLQNDMLMLELTCRTPNAQSDYLELQEQREIIRSINLLLDPFVRQLYRRVGSQNMRLILIGKPELGYSIQALENARLPHGTFNVAQAAALLNTYLMAIYGNGQYILGGHYNSIYFNHLILEKQQINYERLLHLATQFLRQFQGIQSVYTSDQVTLIQGNQRETESKLRNTYNKQCFGDILYTLQPGYTIVNGDNTQDYVTDPDPEVPIYILGHAPQLPTSFSATQVLQLIVNE